MTEDHLTDPVQFDRHTVTMLMLRDDAPVLSQEQADQLQDAHLAHIADLVEAGEIVAVGPPVDRDDERWRGMAIWSVDQDTARRASAADPGVLAGRYEVRVATWLVPAGMLGFHRVRVPRSTADV